VSNIKKRITSLEKMTNTEAPKQVRIVYSDEEEKAALAEIGENGFIVRIAAMKQNKSSRPYLERLSVPTNVKC